jgi:predicted house-cleaning noncanonical NTP pyrophosphatase (MazG superfamily)
MNKRVPGESDSRFTPVSSVILVTEFETQVVQPCDLLQASVGEKAFGLACLPPVWTLPFFVISDSLLTQCRASIPNEIRPVVQRWLVAIKEAASLCGIRGDEQIIVRSSGLSEGLDERGQLVSRPGSVANIEDALLTCLTGLIEVNLKSHVGTGQVPLVIQRYIPAPPAKGHLTNERRVNREARDWCGSYEDSKKSDVPFKINLRNWRKKVTIDVAMSVPLVCDLSAHIAETLKYPAAWAYEQKMRVHYEWVWDGRIVYIVQADRETTNGGEDPTVHKTERQNFLRITPRCLARISQKHGSKYEKVRNVFTYIKLGLPAADLYILDDQEAIAQLAQGVVLNALRNDIEQLVSSVLIIRTDLASSSKEARQLLPKCECSSLSEAIDWLVATSRTMIERCPGLDIAFIFHNFIPAASAAFAYAAPNERKVQIEALWGLPEGLYYNAHDQYIVDTQNVKLDDLNPSLFIIQPIINCKRFFVSPDEDHRWTTKRVNALHYWRRVITRDDWLRDIALATRRIAEAENKPISVMWFIGVNRNSCSTDVFPWYHENYDVSQIKSSRRFRTKTHYDQKYIIKSKSDLDLLENTPIASSNAMCSIWIEPSEDQLLRDKDALRRLGDLASKRNGVIVLEGGLLSHAYYQLMQTNATVEVKYPFDDFEDRREFNKVVRDKIPDNITSGGEIVKVGRLHGDELIRALRHKLVEEAFEVLDAFDQDSIITELADVLEVIDGILTGIGTSRAIVEDKQRAKREKSGGFQKGLVLLETSNPVPTTKPPVAPNLFASSDSVSSAHYSGEVSELRNFNQRVDKWADRKETASGSTAIFHVTTPVVRDTWATLFGEVKIDPKWRNRVRIKLSGWRTGNACQFELSITNSAETPIVDEKLPVNQPRQLTLSLDDSP